MKELPHELTELAKWHKQQAENELLKVAVRKRPSWRADAERHQAEFHLAAAATCHRALRALELLTRT